MKSYFSVPCGPTLIGSRPSDRRVHQRHHLGGEALQAFDTFGDRLAAEVEDQLVHADRVARSLPLLMSPAISSAPPEKLRRVPRRSR